MTKTEVLQQCTIAGNIVKLPAYQLDRATYLEVAKALNLIGGKWKGGKISGFVFDGSPGELLAQITGGKRVDLKKDFQYFPTPAEIADYLVELAGIEEYDMILEPSAGQGAIIKAIQRKHSVKVHYCELMDINRSFLERIPQTIALTPNFLTFAKSKTFHGTFHKIIANPPFSKNQDIDHIVAMHKLLHEAGRLVSVASKHWQYSSNKKEVNFRNWLNTLDHEVIELEAGAFKESGTNIATCIIVINN